MNNGILASQPFSVAIDLVGIKPLLGVPQSIPTPYHLPKKYDWTIGNNDGTSCKDLVYTISTTILGSTTILIPYNGLFGTALTVDWGDGSQGGVAPAGTQRAGSYETIFVCTTTVQNAISHTYVHHGEYKITIKGLMSVLEMLYSAYTPITSVLSYGDINWKSSSLLHGNVQSSLIYVPPVIPVSVTNLSSCFRFNAKFNHPNISLWDISRITNMSNMFNQCGFNQDLSLWGGKVGNVTDFSSMFSDSSFDGKVDNWNLTALNCSCASMFFNNSNFTGKGLLSWNTSGVINMAGMFTGCRKLNVSGVWNWNTSNVTTMSQMFWNSNPDNVDLSLWDVSKVTNMQEMFLNVSSFVGSGLSNWKPTKCTNFTNMFNNFNSSLQYGISGWTIASGANLTSMFQNATAITSGDFSNWTFSEGNINCTSMFNGCTSFQGKGLGSWSTNGIANMASMFINNRAFTGLDINNWNVTGVTNISSMFQQSASYTGLQCNLSGWNLCNCTNMTNFMLNCNIGTGNYDILLNSWEATSTGNPVKPWATGINVHFGTAKYTSASSGARQRLVNYGWTITDGGFQA